MHYPSLLLWRNEYSIENMKIFCMCDNEKDVKLSANTFFLVEKQISTAKYPVNTYRQGIK